MNPLLEYGELPAFDQIQTEHVVPAVEQTLDAHAETDRRTAGHRVHRTAGIRLLAPLEPRWNGCIRSGRP